MTNQKHTALPWKVQEQKFEIESEDSTNFETTYSVSPTIDKLADCYGLAEQKANAEFIVKACNSHYELLEALAIAAKALNIPVPNMNQLRNSEDLKIIRKAIKKAEEK